MAGTIKIEKPGGRIGSGSRFSTASLNAGDREVQGAYDLVSKMS
jgi:hypothetical protein